MRPLLITTSLLLLALPICVGQPTRPVLIGLDVLKPIFSLATPHRPAYQLAEASMKIPLATNHLSITGGYGQLRSGTIHRNVLLDTQGYYLKVGIENSPLSKKGIILGWNALIATCHETGTYSFGGPVFGDYVAPVPERRRVAVGLEGVSSHQFFSTKRIALRISGRATIATLLGPKPDDLPAYFVPGFGHVAGDPVVYSIGLGLHLFYQL